MNLNLSDYGNFGPGAQVATWCLTGTLIRGSAFMRKLLGPFEDTSAHETFQLQPAYKYLEEFTMGTLTCRALEIEDLMGHPAEMVDELRGQLSDCARLTPDPKRAGFYEVQGPQMTYYINVLPASGKVLLLAAWPNE
jgi:hypothetical protein